MIERASMSQNRRVRGALLVAVCATLVDCLLYSSQNQVVGPPLALSTSVVNIRLSDVAVGIVFVLAAIGRPLRPTARGLLATTLIALAWVTFSWIVIAGMMPSLGTALTESRWLLYVLMLAPVLRRLGLRDISEVARRALEIMLIPVGAAAAMAFVGQRPVPIPGFPGSDFGTVGGDLVTIVGCLALLATISGHRAWLLLLLLPLLTNQRAAILGTTVLGLLLYLGYEIVRNWQTGERRFTVSPRLVLTATAAVIASAIISGLSGGAIAQALGEVFRGAFASDAKLASGSTRTYQLEQAFGLFAVHPIAGNGTGMGTVYFFDAYRDVLVETGSAHNSLADIAVRWGIIGVAAVVAVFVTAVFGRTYPRSSLSMIPAIALATVLAKSLFEPAFDKYRLAFTIAFCLIAMVAQSRFDDRQRSELATQGQSKFITSGEMARF